MIRAIEVQPAGQWHGPAVDSVTLDYQGRHRRRIAMAGSKGTRFLLDLGRATPLREGDGLLLESGSIVAVHAAAEPLLEIGCARIADLVRIAWHLGNRHLPTQLCGDRLRIRADHVIREMVESLGAEVRAIQAPFDPEGGAYGHFHAPHGHHDEPETVTPLIQAVGNPKIGEFHD
ncbi:urease accessory protein UreE [Hypericibacter sp.]|uniref:urease accessory protein UreE n=1 Tax=Hypericibacter sp. TaxID=2705401 RepID=UPI003D6D28C9